MRPAERFLDDVGLLEDLLEHEVLEAGSFRPTTRPTAIWRTSRSIGWPSKAVKRVAVAAEPPTTSPSSQHDHFAGVLRASPGCRRRRTSRPRPNRRPAATRRCARRSAGPAHRTRSRRARRRRELRPERGAPLPPGRRRILALDQVREHLGIGLAGETRAPRRSVARAAPA